MKKIAAEEIVGVRFCPDAMEVLEPERFHHVQYYLDEGYKSQDFVDHTTVYRKACIMIEVDGVGTFNATSKLAPWYGFKHPTKEIADQVAKEIDAGILLVAMGEDESEISFERHSLHHGEIAV